MLGQLPRPTIGARSRACMPLYPPTLSPKRLLGPTMEIVGYPDPLPDHSEGRSQPVPLTTPHRMS